MTLEPNWAPPKIAQAELRFAAANTKKGIKERTHQAFLDAALAIFAQTGAFATIGLREVARSAGVVPAAFYRHFDNLDQLALEVAAQQCVVLPQLRQRLLHSFSQPTQSHTLTSMQIFFDTVNENPLAWRFIASERWGGIEALRLYLAQQIGNFEQLLVGDIRKLPAFENLNEADRYIMAEILLSMAFNWAMSWVNLPDANNSQSLAEQQQALILKAFRQSHLLFKGSLNWQSK